MSERKILKISVPAVVFDSCDVTQCFKMSQRFQVDGPAVQVLVFYCL